MFTASSHFLHIVEIHMDRTHVSYYDPCYKKLPLSQVLTQTQEHPNTSADHKTTIRALFDKIDCQGKEKNIEALERMLCAF